MPTLTVKLDNRLLFVDVDDSNIPLRIKERKKYGTYPFDGWYNAPYWNAKHHKVGSNKTIVSKILKKAIDA